MTRPARSPRSRWVVRADSSPHAPVVTVQLTAAGIALALSTPRADLTDPAARRLASALTEAANTTPAAAIPDSDARRNGPPRYGAVPIIPWDLHNEWCGWITRVRHPDRPELAHCAGCGLYVTTPLDS